MIEMRWLRPEKTTTVSDTLQYRFHQPVVDAGGNLCPGDWTEWLDVPVVINNGEASNG